MRDIIQNSFFVNLIIMRITGLYPVKFFKDYYVIYAWVFYALFTVPVPVLSLAELYINKVTDFEILSDTVFLDAQIGIFIIKFLPFIVNVKGIEATFQTLKSKMFTDYLPEQQTFVDNAVYLCKQCFYLFWAFCVASWIAWVFKPLIYGEYKFPINVWLPFDAYQNNIVFILVYVFVCIGGGNAGNTSAAIDTLIPGLLCHAVAQIQILKDNLTHLDERTNEEVNRTYKQLNTDRIQLKNKLLFQKIVECVKHHKAITAFVDQIEDSYNLVLFCQLCGSSLVICICLWRLVLVKPLSIIFFQMLVFIFTMNLEIFLFCYYGWVLYEESVTINEAIYMGKWYEYDIKSKKALLILMEGAKRPMQIIAGKILYVSLELFMGILKKSYSIFAVLKNFT